MDEVEHFFSNFQILGPLGCQGWVFIPQNVKKPKQLHPIGYPASEYVSEAHGLHDLVYPGKTDPVIRVKKIQAEKNTRTVMAVEELHRGED